MHPGLTWKPATYDSWSSEIDVKLLETASFFPLIHVADFVGLWSKYRGAFDSAKNHKRQLRERQSVTAKREKSQTPKVLTAILTLPNLT